MRNIALYLVCIALSVLACNPAGLDTGDNPNPSPEEIDLHDMIVLGSKLEDPYSVKNITKALNSLYPTKAERIVVEPSHIYIRFLPENEAEYERLISYGIDLIDHPVDYEILREGDYYHDPSIREDNITWQYAVIEKDQGYPKSIRYEILDECYIPVADRATKAGDVDWAAIERESFILTGNEAMLAETKGKDDESYYPSGRITLTDNDLDTTTGLKGVKVSCNTFVKFASAFTDEDGNYKIETKYNTSPRYRIVFKNKKGFAIGFNLILLPASVSSLGKNSAEGVSINITDGSDRRLFTRSVVNNTAYDYYDACRTDDYTISSPPPNLRIWILHSFRSSAAMMLQQGVLIDDGIAKKYLGEYTFLLKLFMPDIIIGVKDIYNYNQIYSSTIHELSHASHYMQTGREYWTKYSEFVIRSFVSSGFICYGTGLEDDFGYCEVGEMWSYYCQSKFYSERYGGKLIFGANHWFHPQIFMYLDDRGLSWWKIFAALTSDIHEREKLKKKLISLYPQMKTTITQAFNRYQ